jgi:predicted phage tail protein
MTAPAMQRLVQVRLHGGLGERFGRVHELAVQSAAEAVHALCTMLPGLRQAIEGWRGPGFRVRVGEGERAQWRDEHSMTLGIGSAERIDVVPVIHGRKRNGIGQVIVGAVIAAVSYYFGFQPGVQFGVSLMIGGAIALLSPVPKGSDSKAKEEGSRAINGPPNITAAGGPVPLVIGRMLVGSVTISAGLSTDMIEIANADPGAPTLPPEEPADWNSLPGGGDGGDA